MKAVLMCFDRDKATHILTGWFVGEVRKTVPKMETPFKIYIYETKTGFGCGKVVGEVICEKINKYEHDGGERHIYVSGLERYGTKWTMPWLHFISPKRYDTPKELYEFTKACDFRSNCGVCTRKKYLIEGGVKNFMGCDKRIYRAPQSWCYVEEIEE